MPALRSGITGAVAATSSCEGMVREGDVTVHAPVCHDWRNMGFDQCEVAVLAVVLDQPRSRQAGLEGLPEIGKRFRRHVGVADQIVILPISSSRATR